MDLFGVATQGVGVYDVEDAAPDHVETALAVVTVLHAQGSPIEETRREEWTVLKSFQQDIDRTGMTWVHK